MNASTHRKTGPAAALALALATLATWTPVGASAISRPPQLGGTHMHWYRSHPTARTPQKRAGTFGSTAVVGVRSNRDLAALRTAYGFEHVRAIPQLRAAVVTVDRARLHALLAAESRDPRIRYVSSGRARRRVMSMPNDPLVTTLDGWSNRPYEWQFAASHVDRAFDISKGSPDLVVGTIDTGAAEVPDLTGKVDSRWNVAPDGTLTQDSSPQGNDDFGHGTAVASVIAANPDDGFGMAGFGGRTHVIAVDAADHDSLPDSQVAIALTKLVSLGARIVNMSLGGALPSEPILVDAIHRAAAAGVLLIASTGNEGSHVSWPAADLQPSGGGRSNGLAVGATDVEGNPAYFSNSGKHISLVAPGTFAGLCSGVLVALPAFSHFDDTCYSTWNGAGGGRYGYIEGTSFAAPEVAGIAALIWAARPELKNYEVADIIKTSARRNAALGWTPTVGCGQLDAGAALEIATGVAPAPGLEADAPCSSVGIAPPSWPSEANQTITFDQLPDKTIGDPDFTVRATASSGLPVTFTARGYCTVKGAKVHLTAAGACTVTASQPGDANYNLAPDVLQTFRIAGAAVHALAATGTWAAKVNLRFRVDAGPSRLGVSLTIQKSGVTVASLDRTFSGVRAEKVYSVGWRAPAARTNDVYRFCVADRTDTLSAPSCARIRLR
jgi:hypothetical protein